MMKFYKKVDMRSRNKMVEFLNEHFRYSTMNGWNHSTSFANNMKIYNLGFSKEVEDILFEILYCDDMGDLNFYIEDLISNFEEEHNNKFTAGFNGKSGGYLVLYQMELVPSQYKSYCTSCGQRNFTSVKDTGCKCGRCGKETRIDYTETLREKRVYPGKSFGEEDFDDKEYWDMTSLRDMVKLVQSFDKLCDSIIDECKYYAETHKVVEEEILIPTKIKRVIETQ